MVGDFFYAWTKTLGGGQWHTIVFFSPHGEMEMEFPYLFGQAQAQAQAQRNSDPTTAQ